MLASMAGVIVSMKVCARELSIIFADLSPELSNDYSVICLQLKKCD
jgi:hypothetical protein